MKKLYNKTEKTKFADYQNLHRLVRENENSILTEVNWCLWFFRLVKKATKYKKKSLKNYQDYYIPICKASYLSVQFSHSVVSYSLRPHELQHTRPPCSSPPPGVHSDPSPSSQWWHPAISSSVVPFSSCPQSLPALKSFPMSQLFAWGGQSAGVSALASFLPKKFQG